MKRFAQSLILAVISTLLSYGLLEAGYRIWAYESIKGKIIALASSQFPRAEGGTSIYDPLTGYRYRSNLKVERYDGPFPISWATNNHGHIAREDYPAQKPAGEFRIGLIGDSMTANVTNTVRWGDVLQDHLNTSEAWRASVGGRSTRVINFGLDGIGTVQFGAVASELAAPFGIDLLIVNLIKPDVARRPYYRGASNGLSQAEFQKIILSKSIDKMSWTEWQPELIAATIGPHLGLKPHLTLGAAAALLNGPRHYARADEAATTSVQSFRRLLGLFPRAVFLVHPVYQDYLNRLDDSADALLFRESFENFRALMGEVDFVNMIDRLPKPSSQQEIDSWYNVPADQHNSDKGLKLYGEAIAILLIERSSQATR